VGGTVHLAMSLGVRSHENNEHVPYSVPIDAAVVVVGAGAVASGLDDLSKSEKYLRRGANHSGSTAPVDPA
jgi:hypothetical protein